jgi:hypothetical protein
MKSILIFFLVFSIHVDGGKIDNMEKKIEKILEKQDILKESIKELKKSEKKQDAKIDDIDEVINIVMDDMDSLEDTVVYRYSEWSKYSACTKSCGNGVRIRTRECFGDVCTGPATETKPCKNLGACPIPSSRVHDAVVLKGSDLPELLSVPTWQT